MKPRVIILRTAGTNCDIETAHGFHLAGGRPERVHINQLFKKEKRLFDYDIMAIPGGFSYGDDVAAGKILANEIKYLLTEEIKKFAADGKPIIGICNGFQVLVKTGLLPDGAERDLSQKVTLTFNDSGKFEDRWVYLKTEHKNIWTKGLPNIICLPVAHGEGKFTPGDDSVLRELERGSYVAFRYVDAKGKPAPYPWNPNASVNNIAGISDRQGTILGLMPHPERFLYRYNHPGWTREKLPEEGTGLRILKNAVRYVIKWKK
jgi:phosphoribosylformylglycinamidine synthase